MSIPARLAIHRAAAEWPDDAVALLARLVSMGPPLALLATQRAGIRARGNARPPATSDEEWARAEALGMWRAIERASGTKVLGKIGNVHDGVGDGSR